MNHLNSSGNRAWPSWGGVAALVLCAGVCLCAFVVLAGYYIWDVVNATSQQAEQAQNYVDAHNIQMRQIPAGEFIMGSDDGYNDAKPAHTVNLDAFYIDTYEVTNVMYARCVTEGVCSLPRQSNSATHPDYYERFENYPVIYVDWHDARTYCEWRGMRLPTEAEWEKAARGLNGATYPWGEDATCELYSNCHMRDTTAIGAYQTGRSFYGLYDMAGNVAEWVSSLYLPYPYVYNDGREDLFADGFRVVKGGSWNSTSYGTDVRSILRSEQLVNYNNNRIGFRCAGDIQHNPSSFFFEGWHD